MSDGWSFRVLHRAYPRHFGLTFQPVWTCRGHTTECAPVSVHGLWATVRDDQLGDLWRELMRIRPVLAQTVNP